MGTDPRMTPAPARSCDETWGELPRGGLVQPAVSVQGQVQHRLEGGRHGAALLSPSQKPGGTCDVRSALLGRAVSTFFFLPNQSLGCIFLHSSP